MIHRFLLGTAQGVAWLLVAGCVGTTGGELLELEAYAAGPRDAGANGESLRFSNSRGYDVELTEARLFVGGVYLNRSRATSVSSDTGCTLAGTYVAEVLSGLDVDLLSAEPQRFPERGFATTERALTGEVWLSRGDIHASGANQPILRVVGNAKRGGATYPFQGTLSIGQNRQVAPTDPALPGAHPLCKQRVVSPILVDLVPSSGASLLLRVDPRGMFANVDFSTLEAGEPSQPYQFADTTGADQASDNLYAGMRRSQGTYTFEWMKQKAEE